VFFFRKNKRKQEQGDAQNQPTRPMINGAVQVGGLEWTVREEKRQGPRPQILILSASDGSEMHVRPSPGTEAAALEDVEPLAADPAYRWFTDPDGVRWETRMVVPDPPTRMLVKFIAWGVGVYEGPYPFTNGLGLRSDTELRDLLLALKAEAATEER
jgi:hypothetical protein